MEEGFKLREIVIPIITTIIGAIIGAVVTNNVMVTDYISLDSLDNLVNTYFVQAGLADKSVLELDANEQMASIAEIMVAQNVGASEGDELLMQMSEQLGIDMKSDNLKDALAEISGAISVLQDERDALQADKNSLSEQLESVSAENEELKNRSTADVLKTGFIIDGENITDTLSSGVALIDGNPYYSESMLEAYLLDSDLRYDSDGNNIIYGNEKPEKVRFVKGMVANDYFVTYGTTLVMATDEYLNSIRGSNYVRRSSYMQIRLKEQYSKCSFKVGHIDQTDMSDGTLTVYTRDEYGEFTVELKTIHLYGSMNPEDYELPLNYISDIKIVLNDDGNSNYGITEFYFYK